MTRKRYGVVAALAGVLCLSMLGPAASAPAGPPVRIGSTLALSGPLAATALLHKISGEIFVEQLNRRGGLLGRPVEWVLLDDQSKPEVTRTLYEKLITVDKVDLLLGPYATGAILTAMSVAKRYDKMLVHHTFGVPHLAKYDMQFGTWAIGPEPGRPSRPSCSTRSSRAESRRRRSPSSPPRSRRCISCRWALERSPSSAACAR